MKPAAPLLAPLLLALLPLAACGPAPSPEMAACERQANDDPVVKDLIMKGAGSSHFQVENEPVLRQARQQAVASCLRGRGLVPRGGVERQRPL